MIDVNIRGVLNGIAAVLPDMKARGSGQIINVASIGAHVVVPTGAVYCATKYAVWAISEGLRQENPDVRVTVISPGVVATELGTTSLTQRDKEALGELAQDRAHARRHCPRHRVCRGTARRRRRERGDRAADSQRVLNLRTALSNSRRPVMCTKIALVTGGSRGLGRNTALHLAKAGVDVILTYQRQRDEADKAVDEIEKLGRKAAALQLDTGDAKSFAAFAEQVKEVLAAKWQRDRFDILINNAGQGVHASFAETTEEQFDQLMSTHVKGVYFLTQRLLPLLVDGGRIVNLSTGLTRFATPGFSAYAAMKGAVEVMTRYMAKELGARGIAVNVVAPGAIETDFGGGVVRDNADMNRFIASQTALGRVGQPDDIGGVIASLVSDDNRWINAQRIEASGGMFL